MVRLYAGSRDYGMPRSSSPLHRGPGHLDYARPQSRLLETGTALSRRHRTHDHPEPLDRDPLLYCRQVRPDLSVRGHRAAAERCQDAGAAGGLRDFVSANASTNLLVNREAPPFDNPDLRRAFALALDRKSFRAL